MTHKSKDELASRVDVDGNTDRLKEHDGMSQRANKAERTGKKTEK